MQKQLVLLSALALTVATGPSRADGVRNYISIVGSTTIQPFATAVSDQLAKSAKLKRPLIESTGTGGGFTLFCEGLGMAYPDIVNATRAIKKKEFDACQHNGVTDIVEVKIGYDGIALAQSNKAPALSLSRKELYLALAKQIPDPSCQPSCEKLVPNPYQTWKQINPQLPDTRIDLLGPPASSGTREAFAETVMETGCNSYPWLAAKKAKNEVEYKRSCHSIREDGAYQEETGDTILSRLAGNPKLVGIVGYGLLKKETRLTAQAVDGVTPTQDNIASRRYPLTLPLFFYVKKSHVPRVPGLEKYIAEFTGEKALGSKGYLQKQGLIAMPTDERQIVASAAKSLKTMVP